MEKKTIHISATHFLPVLWFVFYSMWIHTHKQNSVAFFRKRALNLYLLPPTPLFAISSYGNAKRTSLYIFDVIYKDHTPVIDYVIIILLDGTNSWKCTAVFCLPLYLDKIWKFTEPIWCRNIRKYVSVPAIMFSNSLIREVWLRCILHLKFKSR